MTFPRFKQLWDRVFADRPPVTNPIMTDQCSPELEAELIALSEGRPSLFDMTDEQAALYMAVKDRDREHAAWLAKPLSRAEWLDLLHRCQDGEASCMYVLKKIEADIDSAAVTRKEEQP